MSGWFSSCRLAAVFLAACAAAPALAAPFAYITNQDDDSVSVIDTATNTVVATVAVGDKPYSAAVTLDNAHVYVANFSGNSVSVIDARTNTVTTTIAGICTNPAYITTMPGGTQMWVSCFNSAELKRIDIASNTVVGTVSGQSRPVGLTFNPAGSRAYVASNSGFTLREIDTASGTQLSSIAAGFNMVDAMVSADGAHLYSTANGDNRVLDNPLPTGSPNFYALNSAPVALVTSPDSQYLYVTVNGGVVWRIHVGHWDDMRSVAVGGGDSGIDLNGDGTRLYVTNTYVHTVSVIDTTTFTNIATIPVGNYPSTYGHFVAKGAYAALTLPTPPLNAVASAGNAQVSVAFNAPADTGGSVILHYTATCGAQTKVGAASPLLVTGLQNGVALTCTVVATNSVGDSLPSAPSNSVTPLGVVPNTPTGISAVAGKAQATVTFSPPAYDGGMPITGYQATCGSITQGGSASPIVVAGLTNGVAVTCKVVATNAIGDSVVSAASNGVTPGAVPEAPTSVVATRGSLQVSVAFTPGDANGFAISQFHVVCGSKSADTAQSPVIVTGLLNGVAVTCTARAKNSLGDGAYSDPSNSVTPATLPDAPVIGTATRGDAQVSVAFTPGLSDGGAPITNFHATCGTHGGDGANSPVTVSGLSNGSAVACSVYATNSVGNGPSSATSSSVTPAAVPSPPRFVGAAANALNISVNFNLPLSNGGSPITGYMATCGAKHASAAAPPFTVSDLPQGVPVFCTVVATNAVGDSLPSDPSETVTPATTPGRPTAAVATRGDGQVSVAFVAPTEDGGNTITHYLASCDTQTADGAGSPLVVSGLTNGVPVNCVVFAFNGIGNGSPSDPSNTVTPAGVPSAPSLSTITASNGGATLDFIGSLSDNGAAISGYSAVCTPGSHSVTGPGTPLVFAGLTNGTDYSCTVRGINEIGPSAASNSLHATPRAIVDLAISNSNSATWLTGGHGISYLIQVSNTGADTVSGARLQDTPDVRYTQVSWVCTGSAGGTCPPSGNGNLDAQVTLPAGGSVNFLLSGTVPVLPDAPLSNTATVTVPNSALDPNPANDSATDGPDAIGIFRNDFE
jgi:YVTN family beta-propeller protein